MYSVFEEVDPIDYFGIVPQDYVDIDSLVDERIDQWTGGRWQLRQRVTSGLTRIVLPFAGDVTGMTTVEEQPTIRANAVARG